jgi:2-polyprenyl-3-methyl-5-hydroxy-6-metoxy-1,4-benzoquinol methylase
MNKTCRLCARTCIIDTPCTYCGSLNLSRVTNTDLNINSGFTDYSYNRYSKFIRKVYNKWIKLNSYIFYNNSFKSTLLRVLFAPVNGGVPLSLKLDNNTRILDVGCGRADFLSQLPDQFVKTGVEIVRYDNQKDYVIHDNFETMALNKRFDVVRSSHSIEHSINLGNFLDKCLDLLDSSGIFVLYSHNINCLEHILFRQKWIPVQVVSHFCIINPNYIIKYLKSKNFEILHYRTYTIFSFSGSLMDVVFKIDRKSVV